MTSPILSSPISITLADIQTFKGDTNALSKQIKTTEMFGKLYDDAIKANDLNSQIRLLLVLIEMKTKDDKTVDISTVLKTSPF